MMEIIQHKGGFPEAREEVGAAFSFLVSEYSGLVCRILWICMEGRCNEDERRELRQQTFAFIWQRRHKYDANKGSVKTWIALTATSTAGSYRRSKARRREQYLDNSQWLLMKDGSQCQDDHVMWKEQLKLIEGCIEENLTDKQRSVIRQYLQGHKDQEGAKQLDIKVKTYSTRLRDGIARLSRVIRGAMVIKNE